MDQLPAWCGCDNQMEKKTRTLPVEDAQRFAAIVRALELPNDVDGSLRFSRNGMQGSAGCIDNPKLCSVQLQA